MATITDNRSINATLSTTTVDRAQLLQPWDYIEITNCDGSNILYCTDDGSTNPTAGLEGAVLVPVSSSRTIRARRLNPTVNPDGSTVIHEIRVLGNGGVYSVRGVRSDSF